jgi:hypothetical protein
VNQPNIEPLGCRFGSLLELALLVPVLNYDDDTYAIDRKKKIAYLVGF